MPVKVSRKYDDAASLSDVTVPSPGVTVEATGVVPNTSILDVFNGALVNASVEPDIVKFVPGY